jgi:hypothetical protein
MGIFSSIFESRATSPGGELAVADSAIARGRAGAIPVEDMLGELMRAQILIPLAGAPTIENNRLVRWKPATVSKPDGTQLLLAFTSDDLLSAFAKRNPEYPYAFLIGARWVLGVLPDAHGILFNVGGENGFEWSAKGLAEYRRDVLRDA